METKGSKPTYGKDFFFAEAKKKKCRAFEFIRHKEYLKCHFEENNTIFKINKFTQLII